MQAATADVADVANVADVADAAAAESLFFQLLCCCRMGITAGGRQ